MKSRIPLLGLTLAGFLPAALQGAEPAGKDLAALRAERRLFQDQELITAKPFTRVFTPGEPPRIVWRDVEEVRRLGGAGKPVVRWFDAALREVAVPDQPGRWAAWVEDAGPNGTPVRRILPFYARPPGFFAYLTETLPLAPLPGPILPEVWQEHRDEIDRLGGKLLLALNDTEAGAILLAGLTEAEAQGRPAKPAETAEARNDAFQLALKLKVQGLAGKVRGLKPPRRLDPPAPKLRAGTAAEAGMRSDARKRIQAVLKAWEADTHEPFVTLVARRGVIVTHLASGTDAKGQAIGLDYRSGVASITKTATAILFSQFLEQGLVRLDDPISVVFPDYPKDSPHVPTFRQGLTHTSGFSGHGNWRGARNPLLDNILLNGLDANEPGKTSEYSGMGFDLAALAMQILSGKDFTRLYHEHLFAPLGMRTATIEDGSAGAHFAAHDLAALAQWLVNQGRYGPHEHASRKTFETLLPRDLLEHNPGVQHVVEGIGMHWMKDYKPGTDLKKARPEDLILSERTVGHGSLSSCVLRADLDRQLVVVQIRRQAGPRFGEWLPRLLQAVADSVLPEAPAKARP